MFKFNWKGLADSQESREGMNDMLTTLFGKAPLPDPIQAITCREWNWGEIAPEMEILSMTAISEDVRTVLEEKYGLSNLNEQSPAAGLMVRVALDFQSAISFTLESAVGLHFMNLPVLFRCKRLHLGGIAMLVIHDDDVFIGFEAGKTHKKSEITEGKEESGETVDKGPFKDLQIEVDLGDASHGRDNVLTDMQHIGVFLVERLQELVCSKLVLPNLVKVK